MKRLLLTIFALVAMTAGMQATDYGFKMLHIPITSDNYQSESAGKAWSYDPAANVLHLKDGYITFPISMTATILEIDGDVNPSLKIQVDGNCHFSGSFAVGIAFTGNGNHTICGEGTLTMAPDRNGPQVIKSYGSTGLTIKDVTINIEAWGSMCVGFQNNGFREIVLDYCEINIKTSAYAWISFGVDKPGAAPVLKNCYLSNGYFQSGTAYESPETGSSISKEVYIKRVIYVYDVAVTVDEPVAGNEVSTNCTPNSDDYRVTSIDWFRSSDGNSLGDYMPEGSTFNKGESYRVYVHLVLKDDGKRYADEKDMKVYVNGKEGEIYYWGAQGITLMYTFPQLEFEKYDLWVGATQVTELNQEDVLGDGKVSFDPETNTLTLNNANIHAATGYGIQSKLSYVKIVLIGENTITADNGMGVRFQPGAEEPDKAIIRGGGSLNIKASTVGLRSHLDLFLQFGAKITSEGGTVGFQGWKPASHAPLPTLTMTQLDTMLRTKGARQGSLVDFGQLNLHRGMVIMQPSGATYAQDIGIMKDNSVVANEWVMICSQDYIDGISPTPATSRNGGETFNLAGQMVDGKYKGIVIKDGKKVLVK